MYLRLVREEVLISDTTMLLILFKLLFNFNYLRYIETIYKEFRCYCCIILQVLIFIIR